MSCALPILVELDGKVAHVLQGFVGEGHVHVHVALAARECSGDLQPFGFHCRQPHLNKTYVKKREGKTMHEFYKCKHMQLMLFLVGMHLGPSNFLESVLSKIFFCQNQV